MTRRLFRLLGSYQDMCDRYGADDPVVLAMRAEITKHEVATEALSHGERRKEKFKKYTWVRQASKEEQGVQTLH